MTVRTAFIGCVDMSRRLLAAAAAVPEVEIAAVVTRAASAVNADFACLAGEAAQLGAACLVMDEAPSSTLCDFLTGQRIELGLCLGWSRLLAPTVIAAVPRGIVGFHPAALPNNRGRHPLIWALALGLTETASTFFLMDAGADTGPILDQVPVPILPDDEAGDLYARVADTAVGQLTRFLPLYATGRLTSVPQPVGMGNSWRRRTALDGRIDWRMTPAAISALVRALAPPYPGASCLHQGQDAPVMTVEMGPAAPDHLEPGLVLAVEGERLLVKCWGGSIWILRHGISPLPQTGAYLQ